MWQTKTLSSKSKGIQKSPIFGKKINWCAFSQLSETFKSRKWWNLGSNPISLVEKRFTTFRRFLLGGKLLFRSIKSLPLSWFGFRSSHFFSFHSNQQVQGRLSSFSGLSQTNENVGDWFEYIWSMTRAIRKDITQQDLKDPVTVELVEKCARFHIVCSERLIEEVSWLWVLV